MTEEFLLDIGFRKNEAKVYLNLLKKGLSTVNEISSSTFIHRTNIYDCLERLMEKGLINFIHKDGKKYYQSSNPNKFKENLKEKEEKFSQILPKMMELRSSNIDKELAEIHRGMKAVKLILKNFLKKKQPILVYGIPKKSKEILGDFIDIYHKLRIKKKITIKHIYDGEGSKRARALNTLPYTQAKYIPELKYSLVSTNICGDEVVFILWEDTPYIIQIKNKEIANSHKSYFNLLWKLGKR